MESISFIVIACSLAFGYILDAGKGYWTLMFVLFIGWCFGDGYEETQTFTHKGYVTKHLVSAAPSHTQINGSIGGNFLFFSGVIQENRVYLLREEVEKGLYKDF